MIHIPVYLAFYSRKLCFAKCKWCQCMYKPQVCQMPKVLEEKNNHQTCNEIQPQNRKFCTGHWITGSQ